MPGKLDWSSGGFAKKKKERWILPHFLSLSLPLSSSPSHVFSPPWDILRSEWWADNSFYFMFQVNVGGWPEADKSTLVQRKDQYHLWTVLPLLIFHQSIGKVIFWRRTSEQAIETSHGKDCLKDTIGSKSWKRFKTNIFNMTRDGVKSCLSFTNHHSKRLTAHFQVQSITIRK